MKRSPIELRRGDRVMLVKDSEPYWSEPITAIRHFGPRVHVLFGNQQSWALATVIEKHVEVQ